MKRKLSIMLGSFATLVILMILAKNLGLDRPPEPKTEAARVALAQAEFVVPALDRFKAAHGRYPCDLVELGNSVESTSFNEPPYYQATQRGYHLFIDNPGGTNMIRYEGMSEWAPCTYGASCPTGEFAQACCGKHRYPKCDRYISNADNQARHGSADQADY
jgi:hypothetical protein